MMTNTMALETRFAPAERAFGEELDRQVRQFHEWTSLRIALDAVPNIVMALNHCRQLIYCNQALLDLLRLPESEPLIGLRPGEILHCTHSAETVGGCGTTEFCRTCGAVRAILSAQAGRRRSEECRILTGSNGQTEALDLRVWAVPFELDGEPFTVFTLADIRDEKRRAALERVFFHDVLNTVGALQWTADLLGRETPDIDRQAALTVRSLIQRLSEEIVAQRDLIAAENHYLCANPDLIRTASFLRQVVEVYRAHPEAVGRTVELAAGTADIWLTSDPVLLSRVVGNMLRNALEAVGPGESVTTGCRLEGDTVEIWVHNPGVMSREVQLQLFQRSFSTKGAGRGLGTYGMKLLTERYLHGHIVFSSTPEGGTRFSAFYPVE